MSEFEKKLVKDAVRQEESHKYESETADLRRMRESAVPAERGWIEGQVRRAQWEQARTVVRVPHDFQPTM